MLTSRQSIGKNLNQEELVLFWPLLPQRECHPGIYQLYYIFMFHTNKGLGQQWLQCLVIICEIHKLFLSFQKEYYLFLSMIFISGDYVHNVILQDTGQNEIEGVRAQLT